MILNIDSVKILNLAIIKRVFFKKIIKYKLQMNLNYNNNTNINYKIIKMWQLKIQCLRKLNNNIKKKKKKKDLN